MTPLQMAIKLAKKFVKKVETGRARSQETYQDCLDFLKATESPALSGQAELPGCIADLAECKRQLQRLVDAVRRQNDAIGFEGMALSGARKRAERYLAE